MAYCWSKISQNAHYNILSAYYNILSCYYVLFRSLNGVYINDKRLDPMAVYDLNDGDKVQYGSV